MSAKSRCESAPPARPAKNRLFCPKCGHDSPTTGDWALLIHETADGSWLAYHCPACEFAVTRRPLPRE